MLLKGWSKANLFILKERKIPPIKVLWENKIHVNFKAILEVKALKSSGKIQDQWKERKPMSLLIIKYKGINKFL